MNERVVCPWWAYSLASTRQGGDERVRGTLERRPLPLRVCLELSLALGYQGRKT